MKEMTRNATTLLARVMHFHNPITAFSGGKDALVTHHLASMVDPRILGVEETSFFFSGVINNHKEIIFKLGFNVIMKISLTDNFVQRNSHIIFSADNKVRAWTFAVRQQKTVKDYAKKHGHDCIIYGRRTQENAVPKSFYQTKDGLHHCHPLKDWKHEEVWEYIKTHNLPVPLIYGYRFGEIEGNAPFYTLNRNHVKGGVDECWEICREVPGGEAMYWKFKHLING